MELQAQWYLALIAMDRSTKPTHWTIREITTSKGRDMQMTPLETLLTSEIAELKAELANRPIVWAIEHIKEKTLVKRFGAVMLFQTKEDVEEYIPTGFSWPHCWHAVVYKGVARWFDNSRPEDPPHIVCGNEKNERQEHGTK